MRVVRAELWAAAKDVSAIPAASRPEVAIAGRSNVGKSSLINRLTGRKRLARTSGTPGCTRGLVFFNLDDRLTLVDLPGYGWARRSQREREGWKRLVEGYLMDRPRLGGVLVLVDVRRGPEEEERMLVEFLRGRGIDYAWVLTKTDKLSKNRLKVRVGELLDAFDDRLPILVTSAQTGVGIADLWRWIESVTTGRPRGHVRRG